MDWVHCNHCYTQPGDVDMKKFFITNCGHIYCGECLQMNQTKECRICHMKYTTIPLSSKMNSDVEIYFHDPVVSLNKQIKILEFQQSHRIRLVSYNRDRIRSYKSLKKENFNLSEELNLFKRENSSLRDEVKRLKELLQYQNDKCEFSGGSVDQVRSSQTTPRMHSFSQFMGKDSAGRGTPKTANRSLYSSQDRLMSSVKHPSNSNFFLMSDSKSSNKQKATFSTPEIPKFPGTYRTNRILTPETNTPPTPDSIIRELSQRDPLQRKVKLSGSKSVPGPSPATKIGFHGLSLSRAASTPNKQTSITNKYLKYFK